MVADLVRRHFIAYFVGGEHLINPVGPKTLSQAFADRARGKWRGFSPGAARTTRSPRQNLISFQDQM